MVNIDYDFINALLSVGLNVLFIENEYWITHSWIPSDGKAFDKHKLNGMFVSDFIRERSKVNTNQLLEYVASGKVMEVYFSPQTHWRHYVK